jgi:MFS family permease
VDLDTRDTRDVLPPGRSTVLATAAVFALNATVISAWITRLPATRDRLDADPRTIGAVLLMMGLGALVAMPVVGRLASRYGSGPVVIAMAVTSGISIVAVSVAPGVLATAALLFVMGAAYGSWDVAMNIQASFVDRTLGRDIMPRYHACWSVGGVCGASIGAIAAAAGVPLVVHFSIVAVLAVGGTTVVVLRWFVDDREAAPEREHHHVSARLLGRRILLIGVITLCASFLEGAAADWVALYLTDDRQQTQSIAAIGYAVFAVAMATSRFAGTNAIDRLGRARTVRIAGVVVTAGVVCTLTLPGVGGALAGVLLWGAGVALVFPAAMSAGGEAPGRAADGIAAVSTIGYGGFLIGPPLIGLLAQQWGLGHALWVLPVLGAGVVALAPVVAPPRRP